MKNLERKLAEVRQRFVEVDEEFRKVKCKRSYWLMKKNRLEREQCERDRLKLFEEESVS